jgi:hypothetical protein
MAWIQVVTRYTLNFTVGVDYCDGAIYLLSVPYCRPSPGPQDLGAFRCGNQVLAAIHYVPVSHQILIRFVSEGCALAESASLVVRWGMNDDSSICPLTHRVMCLCVGANAISMVKHLEPRESDNEGTKGCALCLGHTLASSGKSVDHRPRWGLQLIAGCTARDRASTVSSR